MHYVELQIIKLNAIVQMAMKVMLVFVVAWNG